MFIIVCIVLWITVCLIFFYHSIIRPSSIDGFWLPFISIVNPHLLIEAVFVLTISADIRNARHWSTLLVCFTLFVSSHDLQCYTVYWYHFASVHRLCLSLPLHIHFVFIIFRETIQKILSNHCSNDVWKAFYKRTSFFLYSVNHCWHRQFLFLIGRL